MPLYLAFRGRWLDLAYEISGVWVLGPKLQFHIDLFYSQFLVLLFLSEKKKVWSKNDYMKNKPYRNHSVIRKVVMQDASDHFLLKVPRAS
jgi:hypothetical protein